MPVWITPFTKFTDNICLVGLLLMAPVNTSAKMKTREPPRRKRSRRDSAVGQRETLLVRIRERCRFGLKYLSLSPQRQLENVCRESQVEDYWEMFHQKLSSCTWLVKYPKWLLIWPTWTELSFVSPPSRQSVSSYTSEIIIYHCRNIDVVCMKCSRNIECQHTPRKSQWQLWNCWCNLQVIRGTAATTTHLLESVLFS